MKNKNDTKKPAPKSAQNPQNFKSPQETTKIQQKPAEKDKKKGYGNLFC